MSRISREKGFYKKLFLSTFYISSCTFGGGFVIIPLGHTPFFSRNRIIEKFKIEFK